jgi:uncharacterized protein YhbP (UPF0306 family)
MGDEIVPMEELRRIIISILKNGFTMSLGTLDEIGVWVSDVTYINDEDYNLYWLSRVESRHSEAILKNPNVVATITLSDNPNREVIGLQISGIAEKLGGEPSGDVVEERVIKSKDAPPSHPDGSLYPITAWYKLKPKKIELMDVPLFGFNKKVLEL